MGKKYKADLKQEVLGVILAFLVAGSLGVGYLAGLSQRSTATVTSTLTITATASPTTPAGISLQLSVNGTDIREGENVTITATLLNTLSRNNNVSTNNDWPFYGLQMFNPSWPPCWVYSPFELVVLKGNFSLTQIEGMGPGGSPNVNCFDSQNYLYFVFEPDGDLVNVTISNLFGSGFQKLSPVNASVSVTTNGYWDNSSSLTYPTPYVGLGQYNFLAAQHSFVQGVYTVAVADEWGQLDVVHLTVE